MVQYLAHVKGLTWIFYKLVTVLLFASPDSPLHLTELDWGIIYNLPMDIKEQASAKN